MIKMYLKIQIFLSDQMNFYQTCQGVRQSFVKTGLVSVDHYDDYVVQLKTQRQKSHYKNNQLCDCATINRKVNSVLKGKTCLI